MENQKPTITVCKKICKECAFNGSTKDTLYANTFNIIKEGIVFPCHMYLKSQTGNESYGVETLKEVKICRGYVAFMKKYGLVSAIASNYPNRVALWKELMSEIDDSELDEILSPAELIANNIHMRTNVYISN